MTPKTHPAAVADTSDTAELQSRRRALSSMGLLASLGALGTAAQVSAATAPSRALAGKAAIVTGARNNMGRAIAVMLARHGADVVVHYHRAVTVAEAEETARLVREQGVRAALVSGDLGEVANVRKVYDTAAREFGRIDIVVNCAGLIIKKPVTELTEDDYERSQRVNTKALLFSIQEAARRLADGGRIISIGTSLLAGAAPGYAVYAGTKAPAEEFSRIVAREVGKRGITVNVVAPGPIDTPFYHRVETPESTARAMQFSVAGRLGKIDDVVPLVEFLALPQSQWVTGQTLWINGGYLTR